MAVMMSLVSVADSDGPPKHPMRPINIKFHADQKHGVDQSTTTMPFLSCFKRRSNLPTKKHSFEPIIFCVTDSS